MSRHTFKTQGNIGVPKGWLPIEVSEDPLTQAIRVIYNGTASAITVTVKMTSQREETTLPIGPWDRLEGEYTHITAVSDDTNVFMSE